MSKDNETRPMEEIHVPDMTKVIVVENNGDNNKGKNRQLNQRVDKC